MDRELDAGDRYRRLGRRAAVGLGALGLCVVVLILLPGWLRPSVAREQVRTGTVDRGPVEGIVEASGTVVPAFEGVISSPVEARVEKVLKRPGDLVKAGDPILALDTSAARLDLGKIEDQLAKKANEQQQLRITLEKSLNDLRARSRPEARRRGERMESIGEDGTIAVRLNRESLTVRDSGPGIPEEVRALLFTPFFSTKRNGRGLGLTLVQEILSAHGFDFSLGPAEGGGAEFRVGFSLRGS